MHDPVHLEDGLIMRGEQIYVPVDKKIMKHIHHEAHEIPIAGHIDLNKTLEKVSRTFYWPKIHKHIQHYISTCMIQKYQENKPINQLLIGLLQPLLVPKHRWQKITMDFIVQFPVT